MFTTQQPLLNAKGLLTAMVAALLSGQALAETAGRVNFIVGEVSAINIADGSRRVLSKGDLVNSGERLETGRGRLQIRFTDGSFVSLQPNTVFGLDNYTFAKNKPEEGSLFFNFIRGGMRTVSGAIGKVNRANYKVKTPVATIGIRGTGYAGSMNNGVLVVSVSKGIVNLSNDFGSSNVPAGQTFQTQDGKAPEPAPEGVTANARADSPESRQEQRTNIPLGGQLTTTVIAAIDRAATTITAGPLFPNSTITISNTANPPTYTITPFYALAQTQARTSTGSLTSSQLGVHFNNTLGDERNALITVDEVNPTDLNTFVQNSVFNIGTLKTANIKTLGALSFGEWTDGAGTFDGQALTLGSNQFLPYIVGLQATDVHENQLVTFKLDQASLVRNNTSSITGILDRLNLTVNYGQGLVDVDMQVDYDGSKYMVNKTGIHRFQIDNSGGADFDDLLATSSNAANCAQGGCPTTLDFFFAGLNVGGKTFGTQAGAAYQIGLANSSTLSGTAALVDPDSLVNIAPTILKQGDPQNQINGSQDTIYAASFVSNSPSFPLVNEATVSGKFDPRTGELLVANNATGGTYGRVDNDFSAITIKTGSFQKVLAWGQWHNGDVNHPAIGTIGLNPADDLQYIIGLRTTLAEMAGASGSVNYSFVGGTSQAVLDKGVSAVNQTGNLGVDFTNGTANLSMTFTGFDLASFNNPAGFDTLTANGSTTLNGTSTLSFNNLSVNTATGSTALLCVSCTGTAGGRFMGHLVIPTSTAIVPQAAGVAYQLTGTAANAQTQTQTSFKVSGTQGFGNPGPSI